MISVVQTQTSSAAVKPSFNKPWTKSHHPKANVLLCHTRTLRHQPSKETCSLVWARRAIWMTQLVDAGDSAAGSPPSIQLHQLGGKTCIKHCGIALLSTFQPRNLSGIWAGAWRPCSSPCICPARFSDILIAQLTTDMKSMWLTTTTSFHDFDSPSQSHESWW